ncbi:MAG: tyrosine-type recombinase/integrase, partial [Acidimicrobiales bacterium]
DNPNGAAAKSLTARHIPVRVEVVDCYDRYLVERERCPAAQACDFVLVNLAHAPLGQPMRYHTVRQWLVALSARAGLEAPVAPHMFRHATAAELLARGATLDVVKELLGHASILTTQRYANPTPERLRVAIDGVGPLRFDGPAGERA